MVGSQWDCICQGLKENYLPHISRMPFISSSLSSMRAEADACQHAQCSYYCPPSMHRLAEFLSNLNSKAVDKRRELAHKTELTIS